MISTEMNMNERMNRTGDALSVVYIEDDVVSGI